MIQVGRGAYDPYYDPNQRQIAGLTPRLAPETPQSLNNLRTAGFIAGPDVGRPAIANGFQSDPAAPNPPAKPRLPIGMKPKLTDTDDAQGPQPPQKEAPLQPLPAGKAMLSITDKDVKDGRAHPGGKVAAIQAGAGYQAQAVPHSRTDVLVKRQPELIDSTAYSDSNSARSQTKEQRRKAITTGQEVPKDPSASGFTGRGRTLKAITQGQADDEEFARSRNEASSDSHLGMTFHELRRIFDTLDVNKDGSITYSEFIAGIKRHKHIAARLGENISFGWII